MLGLVSCVECVASRHDAHLNLYRLQACFVRCSGEPSARISSVAGDPPACVGVAVSWTPPSGSNTLCKRHRTITRRASGLVQIANALIVQPWLHLYLGCHSPAAQISAVGMCRQCLLPSRPLEERRPGMETLSPFLYIYELGSYVQTRISIF